MDGGKAFVSSGNIFMRSYSTGGAGSTNWATGTNTGAQTNRIRFTHTGADFALGLADGGAGVPNYWRMIVNGQYATREGYATPGAGFSTNWFTIDFGSSATRDITIEWDGFNLAALKRRNADTMAKPTISIPTLAWVWDSFGGRINNPTTGITRTGTQSFYSGDSIARRVGDLLGVKVIQSALGGTGFVSGSTNLTRYGDRMLPTGGNDLGNLVYDAIVVVGSSNDANAINNTTVTRAAFQTKVNADIAALAAAYPSVPIVVAGNFWKGGMGVNINTNTEADIRAAVAAAKAATPAARMIFVAADDIIGSGNIGTYYNVDLTHHNSLGEGYTSPILGSRVYTGLQSV